VNSRGFYYITGKSYGILLRKNWLNTAEQRHCASCRAGFVYTSSKTRCDLLATCWTAWCRFHPPFTL